MTKDIKDFGQQMSPNHFLVYLNVKLMMEGYWILKQLQDIQWILGSKEFL